MIISCSTRVIGNHDASIQLMREVSFRYKSQANNPVGPCKLPQERGFTSGCTVL